MKVVKTYLEFFYGDGKRMYLNFDDLHTPCAFIIKILKQLPKHKWKGANKIVAGTVTIESDDLEDIMETDEDLVIGWDMPEPYETQIKQILGQKLTTKQTSLSRRMDDLKPRTKVIDRGSVIKSSTRKSNSDLVSLSEIAEQTGLNPKSLRAILRKHHVQRTHGTWMFDEHEASRIVKLVEKTQHDRR